MNFEKYLAFQPRMVNTLKQKEAKKCTCVEIFLKNGEVLQLIKYHEIATHIMNV